MPPKRKHADDTPADGTATTRATRSSRRIANSTTSDASAKKPGPTEGKADESLQTAAPSVKKSKTTKNAPIKNTPSTSKATKKTTSQRSAASNRVADKSSAIKPMKHMNSDDDVLPHSKNLTEAPTPTTINDPAPLPTSAKKAQPSSLSSVSEPYTASRAQALFKSYAESDDPTLIGPEGFQRLCTDAEIPLEGALPLILAWQFGTKEMMKITEEEWRRGTESLKSSNLNSLVLAMRDLENALIYDNVPLEKKAKKEAYDKTAYRNYCADMKGSFRKLYSFCFLLVKPEQSKNIDMEVATALWSVLLVPKYPIMSDVIGFITDNSTTYKAANKDLWSMMLEFCETVNPNLSDYEGDGAWPTLLDDFVQSKKGSTANGTTGESMTSV